MNYYNHNLGDYARDTAHLTQHEHGAYRLMLDFYYAVEGPLPKKIKEIYLLAKCTCIADRKVVDNVLLQFFHEELDGWHHKRCDAEILKFHEKSAKRSAAAGHRWNKVRNANASITPASNPVHGMQLHSYPRANSIGTNNQSKEEVSLPSGDNGTSSDAFAQRLRDRGVKIENQNPLLIEWSAMAPAALNAAIEKARAYKGDNIPAAYLASVIKDPGKTPVNAAEKGAELGVAPRPGETMNEFQERVARAIATSKRMT